MDKLNIKESVLLIKDCEEIKSRIDKLVDLANKVANSGINEECKFQITPPEKDTPVLDSDNSLSGLGPLSFSYFGTASPKLNPNILTETLDVSESLVVINSLILINRDKINRKIVQLRQLGVEI